MVLNVRGDSKIASEPHRVPAQNRPAAALRRYGGVIAVLTTASLLVWVATPTVKLAVTDESLAPPIKIVGLSTPTNDLPQHGKSTLQRVAASSLDHDVRNDVETPSPAHNAYGCAARPSSLPRNSSLARVVLPPPDFAAVLGNGGPAPIRRHAAAFNRLIAKDVPRSPDGAARRLGRSTTDHQARRRFTQLPLSWLADHGTRYFHRALVQNCEAHVITARRRTCGDHGVRVGVRIASVGRITQGYVAVADDDNSDARAERDGGLIDVASPYHTTSAVNGEMWSPEYNETSHREARRLLDDLVRTENREPANNSNSTTPTAAAAPPLKRLLQAPTTSDGFTPTPQAGPLVRWDVRRCGAWPPAHFWWGVAMFELYPSHGLEELTNSFGKFAAWVRAAAAGVDGFDDAPLAEDATALSSVPAGEAEARLWLCTPIIVQQPSRHDPNAFPSNLDFVLQTLKPSSGPGRFVNVVALPRGESFELPRGAALLVPAAERPNAVLPCSAFFVHAHLMPAIRRQSALFQHQLQQLLPAAGPTSGSFGSSASRPLPLPWLRVAIIKAGSTRSISRGRGFALSPAERAHLQSLGFVLVADTAPKAFRAWLVNRASVVLTSWGGAGSLLALLFDYTAASNHRLPTPASSSPVSHFVYVLHSGYDEERSMIPCFAGIVKFSPTAVTCCRLRAGQYREMLRFGMHSTFVRLPQNNLTRLRSGHVAIGPDRSGFFAGCGVADDATEPPERVAVA